MWALPYVIEWQTTSSIQESAQVVDGRWALEAGGIRPLDLGYDRLVAVGDMSWTDYEIIVPITIHRFDPSGEQPPGNGPGVGVLVRWEGHYVWGKDHPLRRWWLRDLRYWRKRREQPRRGWWPLGALGWYRWSREFGYRLSILGNRAALIAEDTSGRKLQLGVRHVFKMQVETREGRTSLYRLKVWQEGAPEPPRWDLCGAGPQGELSCGSALLVAHHADASFGDVSVVPIDTGTTSTPASD
jgi:hypothetical protein